MAWRIDEFLERGEIENRVRGQVTGRLWFAGRIEPVVLRLQGDPWRDLAGHRLEFVNPAPKPGLPGSLAALQVGEVGDITASRKVRVPEVSIEELMERYKRRQPFPWHWGNSLYLEWFSETNGRVVIESASYQLTIDAEPTWDMTAAEEEAQRTHNGGAMERFMRRLTDALDAPDLETEEEPPAVVEKQPRPLTEEEAERLQEESDRLNDRVHARMEAEGPDADLGRIIEEEIERARRERGDPDPTPEELEQNRRWIEEMNAAAERSATAGTPGELERPEHPLALRARELSLRVLSEADHQNWLPESADREHPLVQLQAAVMKAGGKFAGALGRREWPPPRMTCASTIVWLKRASRYLDEARVAAGVCRRAGVATAAWLEEVMAEVDDIAAEAAALIAELRERLAQGFD